MAKSTPLSYSFSSPDITLENSGGKGLNLALLAQAGFNVPAGFILSTAAYQLFVSRNHLQQVIAEQNAGLDPQNPASLQRASQAIRQAFEGREIPPDLSSILLEAYQGMGAPPVAVRSSATAEDLPGFSFAGQQDTYLNITTPAALTQAVVRCWGSLWTARAIGYRARNHIDGRAVSLAVVVQEMVQSESSGVLFTANPLTGKRDESVIDATLGLGEALVSGMVEPDHYVVDTRSGKIVNQQIGSKEVILRSASQGGLQKEEAVAGSQTALNPQQIVTLVQLGKRVADFYGSPQDIEWAWVGDQCYLLQARPITSLYPLPEGVPAAPLKVFFSFAAVQGIMGPMTPLGRDAILQIFTGVASLFGIHKRHDTLGFLFTAGERLWGDLTGALRNTIGRRLALGLMDYIDPHALAGIRALLDEPDLTPPRRGLRLKTVLRLIRFLITLFPGLVANLLFPKRRPSAILERAERMHQAFMTKIDTPDGLATRLAARVELFKSIYWSFPDLLPLFVPAIAVGMATYNLLRHLTRELGGTDNQQPADNTPQIMGLMRGLPRNVTTEMDLSLWQTALEISRDDSARATLLQEPASELAAKHLDGALPKAIQQPVDAFLTQYGMRGLGEIDIGKPRWTENPAHIYQVLKGYLQIDDPNQVPAVVFRRGAEEAQRTIVEITHRLAENHKPLQAHVVRLAAERMRAYTGLREAPKFFIIRRMGVIRQALLESGADLTQAGILSKANDIFFLTLNELEKLVTSIQAGASPDLKAKIAQRRALYQTEQLRKRIPHLLLSDGRAFYESSSSRQAAPGDEGAVLHGSPVSPGVVDGTVHVILDPYDSNLKPGEIMVCPATDPAWTPLFLAAGGLVMETGGMMTHGSVVAREYGIPAVVGVKDATTSLKNGMRIRVDGSSGTIEILDAATTPI